MSGKLFQIGVHKADKISAKIAPDVQQNIIDKIHNTYPNVICVGLGSVGKKKDNDFNGDIDIGVKCEDINTLNKIIHDVFDDTEIVMSKSLFIISMCYKYGNNQYVSVDFILVKDIEYTKFRYYCPNYKLNESKYKVGTKIMFVGMLLNHCKEKDIGVPDGYYGKYVFEPVGLSRFFINKKDFSDYKTDEITTDVDTIVHILFNEYGTINDFNSVETLWDAIHSSKFKYPEELRSIELSFFINCYRKGWEEQVKHSDFKLEHCTHEEIEIELKKQKQLREINLLLYKITKK